jgi:ankyrin repeat protein
VNFIDVNSITDGDSSPLMLTNSVEIYQCLLDHGADINLNTWATTLIDNVMHDKYDLAAYLLSKGANVNLVNEDGNTALHIALDTIDVNITINIKMVELLLRYGADVCAKNNKGVTPLEIYPDIINHIPDDIKEPEFD